MMAVVGELGFTVSSRVTALLVFAGSLGEMVTPFVIGHLFSVTPRWLIYMCLLCVAGTLAVFQTSVWVMGWQRRQEEVRRALERLRRDIQASDM